MTASVAVIWGSHRLDPQFQTHHSFWEATLKERGDLEVFRYTWQEWPDMPKTHDLYLFIDFHPSLYWLTEHSFKNTAFYWWDSYHQSVAVMLQLLPSFDRCYFAEQVSAVQARYYGYDVRWLPPAFYPGVFHPIPGRVKVHDYAFVGQMDSQVFLGYGVYGHDVNSVYNDAAVLFERTIFSTVGTRFFELVGSGGFCLMNRLRSPSGIEHLAVDGIHYASYDDTYVDFERKLRYYLERPEERAKIVTRAQEYFLEHHTYAQRLNVIMADFGLLP
jgi:hypothetical protein